MKIANTANPNGYSGIGVVPTVKVVAVCVEESKSVNSTQYVPTDKPVVDIPVTTKLPSFSTCMT